MIPLSSGIYATNPDLSILYAHRHLWHRSNRCLLCWLVFQQQVHLIGGIRSAAQLTAYEIPLLLTFFPLRFSRDVQHHRKHSFPA